MNLYLFKVAKSDAYIRLLFTNPVSNSYTFRKQAIMNYVHYTVKLWVSLSMPFLVKFDQAVIMTPN